MADRTDAARTLEHIAEALGVPVSSFYDGSIASSHSSEAVALRQAVVQLLLAFAAVHDPEEHRRCIAVLNAETQRLRDLMVEDED